METKRIIVLANSIKKKARCVAGVEVESDSVPAVPTRWIRPVSDALEGELESQHMLIAGGRQLVLLDIVDIPLTVNSKDRLHPEDWVVDVSREWIRVGSAGRETLEPLEEKPANLWLESTSHTDRVKPEFLVKRSIHQSLYLIRPKEFRVEMSYEYNAFKKYNQKKTRTRFVYRGQEYLMSLTDPAFTDQYCSQFPALGLWGVHDILGDGFSRFP